MILMMMITGVSVVVYSDSYNWNLPLQM